MPRSQRHILLTDCQLRSQDQRVLAQVTLTDSGGRSATGTAERPQGGNAELWCSAEATVGALREILNLERAALMVKDIVTLEISDGPGVAVGLLAEIEGKRRRLFGLAQAEDDRARSVAKAVLGATNRLVGSA
jgi:hypothetical protein